MRTDVESGASLADAMRKHPKAFDNLFTNMVAAGESGGILDIILQRLSVYIEKAVKLNSQVKSALIYPVSIIVIAALVVFIILWKVIPVFAQLFAGLGGEMPLLTRIVIARQQLRGRLLHPHPGWWSAPATSRSTAGTRRRTAGASSTACCSRSRSSACCCARSPSPASAARSAR